MICIIKFDWEQAEGTHANRPHSVPLVGRSPIARNLSSFAVIVQIWEVITYTNIAWWICLNGTGSNDSPWNQRLLWTSGDCKAWSHSFLLCATRVWNLLAISGLSLCPNWWFMHTEKSPNLSISLGIGTYNACNRESLLGWPVHIAYPTKAK